MCDPDVPVSTEPEHCLKSALRGSPPRGPDGGTHEHVRVLLDDADIQSALHSSFQFRTGDSPS